MLTKRTYTLEEAKKTLENYCAYQERCHKEVVQKLQDMHMIPQAIDVVVVHLLEHNFLNEERFAKTFVSGKLNIKKWGKRRLTLELKKRDVSKTIINQVLGDIDDNVYNTIFNELAQKRYNVLKENDKHKKKKKLIDYLLYRGWEPFLVYEKANQLMA